MSEATPDIIDRCSACGNEMEEGFVTATQSIRWATSAEQGGFFGVAAEVLSKGSFLAHPRCAAFRCSKCRIVQFKY